MGSSKKKKKHERISRLLERPEHLIKKVSKWCRKGKVEKLRGIVKDSSQTLIPLILAVKGSHGQSLLHTACQLGHTDVVDALLRFGANTEEQDVYGNTPAHLAALHGHIVCVTKILQCEHPPDIDIRNNKGQSIRQLVHAALPQEARSLPGISARSPSASPPPAIGFGDWGFAGGSMGAREAVERFRAQRGGRSAEEEEWQQRLREECSPDLNDWKPEETYADEPGVYWSSLAGGSAETEDEWADRMWREMQEKWRQKAAADAIAFGSSSAKARAQEQAAATAAARAVESERILQREKAKDAEWRRKASAGAGLPEATRTNLPVLDPAAAHAAYKAAWEALMVRLRMAPAGKSLELGLKDIAWPLPEGCAYTGPALGDVLLHGVQGPADIKARLREELMRWHPDKFGARLGPHISPAAAPLVTQRVKEVSQALTSLLTGGGSSSGAK